MEELFFCKLLNEKYKYSLNLNRLNKKIKITPTAKESFCKKNSKITTEMVDNVYYWWLMMKTEMQKGINNPYYPRAYPQRMKTSLPNRNYSLIMTSPLSTNSHITEFPLTNLLLSFSLSPHHSSLPFYYFLYKPSTPWACFDSPSPWHQLRAYQYPFLIWTHMGLSTPYIMCLCSLLKACLHIWKYNKPAAMFGLQGSFYPVDHSMLHAEQTGSIVVFFLTRYVRWLPLFVPTCFGDKAGDQHLQSRES